MKIFDGCLLACDIDGTLEVNGEISRRSIDKIHYFVENGGHFSLSTGRNASAVSSVLARLEGYISPSVTGNGTVIYDYKTKKSIHETLLPENAVEIIKKVYNEFPLTAIELHSGYDVYSLRSNQESLDHQVYEKMNVKTIDISEIDNIVFNKVLFADGNIENLHSVENSCTTLCSESMTFKNTVADLGGIRRHYLELIPADVTKASALDELIKILNIKKGGFFAIGDYYNDLEMIEKSDIGCFTADAPFDLQQKADFVSGFAIDGAVADFIDYLAEQTSVKK